VEQWQLRHGGGKKASKEELQREEEKRTEPTLGLAPPAFNRLVLYHFRRRPRPCPGPAKWAGSLWALREQRAAPCLCFVSSRLKWGRKKG
jgi:hypothetical protein